MQRAIVCVKTRRGDIHHQEAHRPHNPRNAVRHRWQGQNKRERQARSACQKQAPQAGGPCFGRVWGLCDRNTASRSDARKYYAFTHLRAARRSFVFIFFVLVPRSRIRILDFEVPRSLITILRCLELFRPRHCHARRSRPARPPILAESTMYPLL